MEKIECVKTRILSKYKIEIRLLTLEDNQFSDMSKRLDPENLCIKVIFYTQIFRLNPVFINFYLFPFSRYAL